MSNDLSQIAIAIPCEFQDNQITAYRPKNLSDILDDQRPEELAALYDWFHAEISEHIGWQDGCNEVSEQMVIDALDVLDRLGIRPTSFTCPDRKEIE